MRTILLPYTPSEAVRRLLHDVRSMVRHLVARNLVEAHRSAIALRKETAEWFNRSWRTRYAAHYHHSACSMAIGICRAYWRLKRKFPTTTGEPRVTRLIARLDQELFRIKGEELVVTTRPHSYLRFPLGDATKHRRWTEWSRHKLGEITLTPRTVVLPFQVPERVKVVAPASVGIDLNLTHVNVLASDPTGPKVEIDIHPLARMQAECQRRRERLQKVVSRNRLKQRRLLQRLGHRQRHRTLDHVRRVVAPTIVTAAGGRNLVFEDLRKTTQDCLRKGTKAFRRSLSRWVHGLLQREVAQRSPATVVYVNPRGTSSECPRCGGPVSHPEWRVAVCGTCGAYDRDFLAGANLVLRGHALLCGAPLPVSVRASVAERAQVTPRGLTAAVVKLHAGKDAVA
jgi:putative transposase